MIKLVSLFIIISFASCAPTRIPKEKSFARYPSRTRASIRTSKGIYYVVKRGDSLWKISQEYGASVKEIMKRNKIYSPHDLKVGQKIFIPRRRNISSNFFFWPVEGEIINFFGENINNSINKGLNIKATPASREVKAAAEGKVVFASQLKGWGQTIILKHGSAYYTIYANLNNTLVREGTLARKRQVIGEVAAGKDEDYILHFEIRKKYIPQDPLRYLN